MPLGAGWARVLRPAVTAELPSQVLHTSTVRELLLRRMVEIADGAAWNADTRQARANRTDWARAIAATEQREFDKLLQPLGIQPRRHLQPKPPRPPRRLRPRKRRTDERTPEQVERLRQRRAAGASPAQIAAELGTTRLAVMSKTYRLRLGTGA